ncbi:BspA family leucine-rich repeat surface protein [Enterococcus caccae]|uniref:Bacterial surface protein 26-residue n=1 Tax=Enterococcus caccae ATCC BAA-1240 TaxID=1158612 RepID=R3X5L9_9ENTE|nr:BspA family leucine-rich repeat surface protein [Enterococcus caccae]EOL49345.1 bacterial surface protein 26-residue [Enterococcus caccae ATCC BAA-1240]EOT56397.1 hypothetical protein I580_03197 [Enterococcus caccae ATCC BAA-1240]OJG25298.1 surface protein [Enterococcus caccae]
MKHKQMIKGLMITGMIGLLWSQSSIVLAEEKNKFATKISDSTETKQLDETDSTDESIPTTIEIVSEKTSLEINETLSLIAKITSENTTIKTVTWTTSDETIATVSDTGVVTAKKSGSVSITASTANKKTVSILLTISEKKEAITGTYGTVPWTWETESQTLIFGEGNFPASDWVNGIQSKIEHSSRLDGKKIKKIVFTKPVVANKYSDYLFFELGELETIDGLELLNTSHVSGMSYMFGAAFGSGNKLSTINVSNWDTSNVTDMSYMFASASNLTTIDVSSWDTSNVTNMFAMFRDASSLTTLDVSKWNTSKVSRMADMFRGAGSLIALETGNWDISNITDMSYMFEYAKSLTTLDVSKWDTSNVKNMFHTFNFASSLKVLDVSNWNTSNVTNMRNLFYSTSSLSVLDISKWHTNNVTDMAYMFGWTTNLTTLDVGNWDTAQVTNMQAMFLHTEGLSTLDVSKWNTSNVTDMAYMFRGASNLTALDVSNWDMGKVQDTSFMFYNAKNLKMLDVSKWDTHSIGYMQNMFNFTSSLITLDTKNWDTSNVKNMAHMFDEARNLRTIDVSNWNTSNVYSMTKMFYNTRNLTEIDINKWDTRKVTKMERLFAYTNSLDTLVLGENTLNILKEASFPEKKNTTYTGKWVLVSPDCQNSYSSSADLIANYDGTKPGKYIREKYGDTTKVSGIELSPSTLELSVSKEVALQTKIIPATANNKNISYTTSDSSVATVTKEGVVKGLKKGTAVITATTNDGNFQAKSTVTIIEQSSFLIDLFYLGIDDYVTGSIDTNLSAKKVQLIINDALITTSTIFKDGSFELDTDGMITKITDKVEVIALDRKNKELERTTVAIEEKSYALNVDPYTLYEDTTVTGQTDYFHTHVALIINGEEIERKLLSSARTFSFDTKDLIDYADDEVEIVGYRYETEVTRQGVSIQEPTIEMDLAPYKVDDPYVTGKVTGKSATSVRLYVNRRRQQTAKLAEDGAFKLLGVAILSPTDNVEIAVLNEEGIELQRFSVDVTN